MKVILLKEKDLGLKRPRPAASEIDIDPETGNAWIADGSARLADSELLATAAKKVNIISKPATDKVGDTATDAKAKN